MVLGVDHSESIGVVESMAEDVSEVDESPD